MLLGIWFWNFKKIDHKESVTPDAGRNPGATKNAPSPMGGEIKNIV